MVALELHMDDIHGAATPSGREWRPTSRELPTMTSDNHVVAGA